jgi:hypothetical protein
MEKEKKNSIIVMHADRPSNYFLTLLWLASSAHSACYTPMLTSQASATEGRTVEGALYHKRWRET